MDMKVREEAGKREKERNKQTKNTFRPFSQFRNLAARENSWSPTWGFDGIKLR